jgi:hypothetical protein
MEVLTELRRRGSLTPHQAHLVLGLGELLARYHSAAEMHGAADIWVEDLASQILRRLDRIDAAARDTSSNATGLRLLEALTARGHARATSKNRFEPAGADETAPADDWLLDSLTRMLESHTAEITEP